MESKGILIEGKLFDLIYLYQFLRRLVKPFNKTKAYELGIIDDVGTVLKKRKDLITQEEKNAYTLFDTLVFNLKKLLAKIPGGKTSFASFAAALLLLKEEKNKEFHILQEQDMAYLVESYEAMSKHIKLNSDLYADSLTESRKFLSEGKEEVEEITTADVPTTQEPVVTQAAARKYKRRNKTPGIRKLDKMGPRAQAGECILDEYESDKNIEKHGDFLVFNVDPETFMKARQGKNRFDRYSKFVGNNEYGEKIRNYGRQNPKMPVILKDSKSGQLCFLRYGANAAEQIKNYYNR